MGALIKPGGTLFKVDGRPVILLDGTMPAYRDLGPRDSNGQDILQLNRNLIRLGFNPQGVVPDGIWQTATTAGVDVLQASLGETETGTLSLGQVVFLPGEQLVSSVQGTLGNASAAYRTPAAAAEFIALHTPGPKKPAPRTTKPRRRQGQPTQTQTLEALIAVLRAEIAELKSSKGPGGSGNPPGAANPGRPGTRAPAADAGTPSAGSPTSAGSPASGGGGACPSAILQTTSAQLVVTVDLDASKQGEAKVGESVTVQLPDGETVNGTVTAVSPVAQTATANSGNGTGPGNGNGDGNGGSSGSTIPVTITLRGRHTGAGLDQATVSVDFAAPLAGNALSVPVTALVATGGGNYAVQTAAAPHTLIPVSTGVFATGFVEISGAGIYPGLRVTDSQG